MKTKLFKSTIKMISSLLALIFIFNSLPIPANAVLEDPFGGTISSNKITDESFHPDKSIVTEDASLRTENSKTFVRGDGSKVVYVYSEPVHYQSGENDAWTDYDNTLELTIDDDGAATYKNQKSDIEVILPESISSDNHITVKTDEYTLELGVKISDDTVTEEVEATPDNGSTDTVSSESSSSEASEQAGDATTESSDVYAASSKNIASSQADVSDESSDSIESVKIKGAVLEKAAIPQEEKITSLEKLSSGLKYDGVFLNSDLEYIVNPRQVKENIIVNEKSDSYVYEYFLKAEGLNAQKNPDNSISLYKSGSSVPVFTIEAPYMFDSLGNESKSIQLDFKAENDGYILIYTADSTWLNAEERQFPVTIDPTITVESTSSLSSPIRINEVDSSEPNTCNQMSSTVQVQRMEENSILISKRLYARLILPELPEYATLTSAQFKLVHPNLTYDKQSPLVDVNLYDVGEAWSPSGIKWNNQPTDWLDSDILATISSDIPIDGSYVDYSWDITSLAALWYAGDDNNGIVLTSPDDQDGRVRFCNNMSPRPSFVIEYEVNAPAAPFHVQTLLAELNHNKVYVQSNDGREAAAFAYYDGGFQPLIEQSGQFILPSRFLMDTFDGKASWDAAAEAACFIINGCKLITPTGSTAATFIDAQGNSSSFTLAFPATIIGGRTYLAPADLCSAFGYGFFTVTVNQTDENNAVYATSKYIITTKDATMTQSDADALVAAKAAIPHQIPRIVGEVEGARTEYEKVYLTVTGEYVTA
ncbi:MAG: DNRLRE domain-containing protein, partial [Oscillospiraceae bacterium]|nr:DNRLRE domain-containing protein [Oscillospiraceae bacterium]